MNTTLFSFSWNAIDDSTIDLNYTISEYPPDFPIQRNNLWYPRASAIGGCTIHNAMENIIGGLRQIFDNIAQMFTDSTWSRDNMQSFYALLEHNLYLTPPNPDHGFDGWLNTTRVPVNFSSTDEPPWKCVLLLGPGNSLTLAANSTDKLTLMTNTLATKVLLCNPQLILSGIGDSKQLTQFGIPSIVHLPGVGSNLQDEVPALWELRQNFTDPVSFGDVFSTSAHSTSLEPDIYAYFVPRQWTGFVHGLSVIIADTPNFFSIVNLKALASSKGYAPGGQRDIVALREGVKRWRRVMNTPKVRKFVEKEVLPGANVTSDEDLDNYVMEKVTMPAACCTNAIGPDDDPQAVLDGDFHVRGVQNLRVVDASSWPEIPGYVPTSPTYVIAEKAAQSGRLRALSSPPELASLDIARAPLERGVFAY
ncbi:choline dehydrogenase [Mycena rebaudengoi]|nr:choline dehydrogenase [Mycena rebaudengoi]